MHRSRTIATSIVLTLALTAFSGSLALADSKGPGGLNVADYSTAGNSVQVVVSNTSTEAKSGSIDVVASGPLGIPLRATKSVLVQGQGTTVVSVSFFLPVSGVTVVGISEGHDPL
jgi:hypothetical protein